MTNYEIKETNLWTVGEYDVCVYHVFSTISIKDEVLVFSEARYGKGLDSNCPHDIVMKRSLDGGQTFLDNVCVVSSAEVYCATNPVPVFDSETDILFLFYSDNIDNIKTRNYYITSRDHGITWSKPQEITDLFDIPFSLAGPGHGIQIKHGKFKGRLLVPFWHRSKGVDCASASDRGYCVSLLYSDNHGNTWKKINCFGHTESANESRLIETADDILWNMRTIYTYQCVSRSTDGGLTWSALERCPLPPAHNCDVGATSLIESTNFRNTVLMSRISNLAERRDMEIQISNDGGKTFTDKISLDYAGNTWPGYSDLCVIKETEQSVDIGLVHSKSSNVFFSRITIRL